METVPRQSLLSSHWGRENPRMEPNIIAITGPASTRGSQLQLKAKRFGYLYQPVWAPSHPPGLPPSRRCSGVQGYLVTLVVYHVVLVLSGCPTDARLWSTVYSSLSSFFAEFRFHSRLFYLCKTSLEGLVSSHDF